MAPLVKGVISSGPVYRKIKSIDEEMGRCIVLINQLKGKRWENKL
jgi:hypothetical protein